MAEISQRGEHGGTLELSRECLSARRQRSRRPSAQRPGRRAPTRDVTFRTEDHMKWGHVSFHSGGRERKREDFRNNFGLSFITHLNSEAIKIDIQIPK